MSKTLTWIEVMRRLHNNPTLQGYVKNIYSFNRDNILSSEMPCIICHPLPSEEVYADFPKRKQDFMRMQIRGIVYIKDRLEYKTDDIVVGDATHLGIYKFEEDIKNAVENWPSGVGDNLSYNQGGVPAGTPTGHYPKLQTTAYNCLGNVSMEVIIELIVDTRYFFAGQR